MTTSPKKLTKISLLFIVIATTILTSCDSDGDSQEIYRAVELERLRESGNLIESVTILGGQTRLRAGETHQLSATGIDSNGDIRDITSEVTWASSDTEIATVNSMGRVTAVKSTDINQGIVHITATTINNMYGEGEISVSDIAVTAIKLKQAIPATGNITSCITANITADLSYQDGYQSLNSVKHIVFAVDESSTASITNRGDLYTSGSATENITITASVGSVTDQLTVTADPSNLESITMLIGDKATTIFSLEIGDRLQVNAQASLASNISTDLYNIDHSIHWEPKDPNYIGATQKTDKKGTLLALKPGVTVLYGHCGGKKSTATVEIKGDASIDSLQINEGENAIALAKNTSLELTLTANYDEKSSIAQLNVSEFAQWSIYGSALVTAELVAHGTSSAAYKLTTKQDVTGELIVSALYEDIETLIKVTIE